MKRSNFLRSLAGVVFAPSLLSEIKGKDINVKELIVNEKIEEQSLRIGDLVRFNNGQTARVQSISLGKPLFRNLVNEQLTDTSSYVLLGSSLG